jgi:HSP20 family protein
MGRWDPIRELDDLHDRMSNLMTSVFGGPGEMAAAVRWTPLADVYETEDAYLVEIEVPGIKREDIDLQIVANELTISGEFKERERAGWLRSRTRRIGRFEYRAILPQDVDPEKISAELSDGVLTVKVAKSETAKPRRISIGGGRG